MNVTVRRQSSFFAAHFVFIDLLQLSIIFFYAWAHMQRQRDDRFFSQTQDKLCGHYRMRLLLLSIDDGRGHHHRHDHTYSRWWFVNWYTASAPQHIDFLFRVSDVLPYIFFSLRCVSYGTPYILNSISISFVRLTALIFFHQRSIYYFYYIFFVLVKWVTHCRAVAYNYGYTLLRCTRTYIHHTNLFSTSLKRNIFPRSSRGRGLCVEWLCTYRIRAQCDMFSHLRRQLVSSASSFEFSKCVLLRAKSFIDHGVHWVETIRTENWFRFDKRALTKVVSGIYSIERIYIYHMYVYIFISYISISHIRIERVVYFALVHSSFLSFRLLKRT